MTSAALDGVTGSVTTYVPVIGGIAGLIWLLYRLFINVDRRSQQELTKKDAENLRLVIEIERERKLRFSAEERAAKAESREGSLESRISDLSDQLEELRKEVSRLREKLNDELGSSPHGEP